MLFQIVILFAIGVLFILVDYLFVRKQDKERIKIDIPQPEETAISQMPLGREDSINHDGVGIVMRPDASELAKFAEPQAIREAKEAVAQTLRNAPEIDL